MLSCKELQFAIETGLHNLGGFQYGDYSTEEIDLQINQEVARIIRELPLKKEVELNSVEQSLLDTLTKTYCATPTKDGNIYSLALPTDSGKLLKVSGTTLDESCLKEAKEIKANEYYKVSCDTLYNETWYKNCDIIKGVSNVTEVYGCVKQIKTVKKSFTEEGVSTSGLFDKTYSVLGNKIELNSKDEVKEVCVTYISSGVNIKVDCCNNTALNTTEDIERFVIDRVVKRIAIISEQNQNKINNLNSQNREQI